MRLVIKVIEATGGVSGAEREAIDREVIAFRPRRRRARNSAECRSRHPRGRALAGRHGSARGKDHWTSEGSIFGAGQFRLMIPSVSGSGRDHREGAAERRQLASRPLRVDRGRPGAGPGSHHQRAAPPPQLEPKPSQPSCESSSSSETPCSEAGANGRRPFLHHHGYRAGMKGLPPARG